MTPVTLCRRCLVKKVNRPRGLCWHCYYTPGVRAEYESGSKYARRGVGNFNGNTPPPPAPTTAGPGTPEKIEVLTERARGGFTLWHPDDATLEPVPEPAFAELVADLEDDE